MIEFNMDGEANRYLIAQRGDFAKFAGSSRFQQAWSEEIEKTIKQIGVEPKHVLDLGSGLGLIDIELHRRFGTFCTLVDSEAPPPTLNRKHNIPFGSRRVTEQFWVDNNMSAGLRYLSPDQLRTEPVYATFDVVISLRSWCFHYAPETYSRFVVDHLAGEATVLVDVRRERVDWIEFLESAFPGYSDKRKQVCVEVGEKYLRMKYKYVGGRA